MSLRHAVDRGFDAAAEVFAGAPSQWLPVIAGPEERSGRAETEEGFAEVRVVVTAGAVVRRDRVRWRRFMVKPAPTDRTAFLAAWLTPVVVGDLQGSRRPTTERPSCGSRARPGRAPG